MPEGMDGMGDSPQQLHTWPLYATLLREGNPVNRKAITYRQQQTVV